jgi:uncharacterized Zn-binding protein involved in type VI secretion
VGPGALTVLVGGAPVSVIFDQIASHGEPPHTLATVVKAATTVFAEGRPVTVQVTSIASCGHPASTGMPTVIAT